MEWSEDLLATAYHEAGHVAFVLRHGRSVDNICVDLEDEGEGRFRSPDWLALTPGLAELKFREGGKVWDDWKRRAFLEAAERLAGPLVELSWQGESLPESLCYDDALSEYFEDDVRRTQEVVSVWLHAAGESNRRELIEPQIGHVEQYVKASLSESGLWESVKDIVGILMQNDGSADHRLLEAVNICRVEVCPDVLAWP